MDELAEKYKGKIVIYKVNTDKEREVSSVFGIRSIPSMLFCPMQGKPTDEQRCITQGILRTGIEEFLLAKRKQPNNYTIQQMEHLTKTTFLEKVFNYEANKEWKFAGNCPAISILCRLVRAL